MNDIKNDNNKEFSNHQLRSILHSKPAIEKYGKADKKAQLKRAEEQLSFEEKGFKEPCYIEQNRGVTLLLLQLMETQLSKTDIRIYSHLWVFNGMQKNIIFDINQVDLANKMGYEKPNISRTIRKLLECGVLEEIGKKYKFTINKDMFDENSLI